MNVLFLLSEEDRTLIQSSILVENVSLRTDPEIQNELLIMDYDTCFITSNYTKVYGSLTVQNIIKTLRMFTSTRIHYLIRDEYESSNDDVIPYMIDLNIGNITKLRLEQLELKEFQKLAKIDRTAVGMRKTKAVMSKERLELLRDELLSITDEQMQEYMKQNRGRIIDLIQGYVELLAKSEVNELKTQALHLELQYLEGLRLQNVGKIQALTQKNELAKKDIRELRNSILENKDKIDDYNEQLVDSTHSEYPIVYLDDLSPPIIYFKEIEDIGFYNFYQALIYTFAEVYKIYIKSIILERSNRHFYNPYTKDGYVMVNNNSKMNTIINHDKLIRYGNPTNLLKEIAKPEFRTEIILIYDRLGTENLTVDAPYLQPYYLGNYREQIVSLDISDTSWISPYEGNWAQIKGLLNHKTMTEEEKLVYKAYASQHPLIKYITKSVIEPLDEYEDM